LPVPKNFPVTWADPAEEALLWEIDQVHFASQTHPLVRDFGLQLNRGFNAAAETLKLPIRWRKKYVNTYDYMATVPAVPLDQMEAQTGQALQALDEAMHTLHDTWNDVFLPEIQEHLRFWEAFDLSKADMATLLEHLDQTVKRFERLWKLHFLVVLPMYFGISQFDDLYQDLFEHEDPLKVYRLLQGFDNKTLASDRSLWELSQRARLVPSVNDAFLHRPAQHILGALQRDADAQAFLDALGVHLEHYGRRANQWSLSDVSWIEDPTPLLDTLKEYVRHPPPNPATETEKLARQREQNVVRVRAQLQHYPQVVQEEFDTQLTIAQEANVLSEDHGYWIDFRANYEVRRVLMEFGRRFAGAGLLSSAQGIFYLDLETLRHTAQAWPPTVPQELDAAAKAEMERFAQVAAPPALGTLPPGPPPQDALTRTFIKFFGAPVTQDETQTDTRVLQGHAGSAGTVRGTARVILSLEQAHRLQQGDVLVTPTTAPPWTPLFATAAAVVTDAGGVLCHCAVIAREYGIPAVVGTGCATHVIQDGQSVEVNGSTGQVRIV